MKSTSTSNVYLCSFFLPKVLTNMHIQVTDSLLCGCQATARRLSLQDKNVIGIRIHSERTDSMVSSTVCAAPFSIQLYYTR